MVATGLFAIAFALRLVYLHQIQTIPSFHHLLIDAAAYDAWAQRIAAGDWLGSEAFYQAPAYPYFLAILYALAGHDLWFLHVVQMGMGALSCVFQYFAARLFVGRSAGLCAALLLAFYPPAIFFDGIVQKTSLALLLTTGLLLLLGLFQRRPGSLLSSSLGGVLALLALTRENSLILIPVIALWIGLRFREAHWQKRLSWLAAFGVGLAVILGPVAAHNVAVGDTFALTTSQLGTNFYYGNGPKANGLYVPLVPGRHTPEFESPDSTRLAEQALGRSLSRGEVSDYWLGRGLDHVRAEPGRWLYLMGWKLLLTWNAFEIPDTEDIYVYADWSWLLRGLLGLLHFGVLLPLACAGMALGWQQRRDTSILIWLGLVYTGGVVLFLVAARFRFPLVPLMAPFAGLAIVRAVALARSGQSRLLLTPAAALLAAALFANLGLLEEEKFRATGYMNFGSIMLREGQLLEAERHLLRAESIYPDEADLQFHLGALRSRQGRLVEAERHLRRMLELEDRDFRAHRMLARVLRRQGRIRAANRHRRIADSMDPDLQRPSRSP
ncbi:MAG: glycosyltransferase family 39 protein [Myxococcota bacterium]